MSIRKNRFLPCFSAYLFHCRHYILCTDHCLCVNTVGTCSRRYPYEGEGEARVCVLMMQGGLLSHLERTKPPHCAARRTDQPSSSSASSRVSRHVSANRPLNDIQNVRAHFHRNWLTRARAYRKASLFNAELMLS
jgi:hypothetical protein